MKTLRLLLGDQLNSEHSWFDEVNPDVMYVMAEIRQETDYVKHHIQKVVAFFFFFRNFSEELTKRGHQVVYYKISDADNPHNLEHLILDLVEENKIEHFEYQFPDEYRLDEQLKSICKNFPSRQKQLIPNIFILLEMNWLIFSKAKSNF